MKILAVDYGDSRTGLATCDHTEFLTTPITPQITLKARNKVAARVCEVAKEIEAELIVIGLPQCGQRGKSSDGTSIFGVASADGVSTPSATVKPCASTIARTVFSLSNVS